MAERSLIDYIFYQRKYKSNALRSSYRYVKYLGSILRIIVLYRLWLFIGVFCMEPAEDYLKEVTPLGEDDCFVIIHRPQKRGFEYPLHIHRNLNSNYLEGRRVHFGVGDSMLEGLATKI